jgi:hypothetical protein
MKTTHTIDNTEDILDSRDIIARIEELENERDDYTAPNKDGYQTMIGADWAVDNPEDADELRALRELAKEAECAPDWAYGETLIRRSYFVDYTEQLINDCYELPKEMNSGQWPFRHMTIDYEAAARELEHDYTSVDFDGVEYLIRYV